MELYLITLFITFFIIDLPIFIILFNNSSSKKHNKNNISLHVVGNSPSILEHSLEDTKNQDNKRKSEWIAELAISVWYYFSLQIFKVFFFFGLLLPIVETDIRTILKASNLGTIYISIIAISLFSLLIYFVLISIVPIIGFIRKRKHEIAESADSPPLILFRSYLKQTKIRRIFACIFAVVSISSFIFCQIFLWVLII